MAVEPDIALQSTIPQPQGNNPMALVENYVKTFQGVTGLQHQQMENQLLQGQIGARQRFGQIMQGGGTPEDKLAAAQADPTIMQFAPDLVNVGLGGVQTQTGIASQKQDQYSKATNGILHAAITAGDDRGAYNKLANTFLSTQPQSVQDYFNQNHITDSLGHYFYDNPGADGANDTPSNRATNMGIISGAIPQPNLQPVTVGAAATPVYGTQVGTKFTPANGGALVGPTAAQQEIAKGAGTVAADLQAKNAEFMKTLPANIQQLDMITDSVQQAQVGGAANIRTFAGKILQAAQQLGIKDIPPDIINKVGNGDLSQTELFDSLVKPYLVRSLKDLQGLGQVRETEYNTMVNAIDKTDDPATIMKMLNFEKFKYNTQLDMAQRLPEFRQAMLDNDPSVKGKGFNEGDFTNWYMDKYKPDAQQGLFPVPESTAKSSNPSPQAPTQSYSSAADVQKAFKSNKIDRATARQIIQSHPEWKWGQ